jgi:hypothetical protein
MKGRHSKDPPGTKVSPELKARRRRAVAKLYGEGYPFDAIAAALGIGSGTAHEDAIHLGLTRKGWRRTGLRTDVPARIDWKTDPEFGPSIAAAYRSSPVIADAQHWIEGFDAGDYPNRFAWNLAEAEAQADEVWLGFARDVLEQAFEQFGRLVRVLDDQEYREQCRRGHDPEVRTTSKRPLRVVR